MGNDVNKKDRPNTTPTVRAICTFAVYFSVFRPFFRFTLVYEGHFVLCYKDVNKKNRPNTTPTVRAICTFAVYFSVFRPFFRFTLVYEGHFVLCYKEKTRAVRSC